MATDLTGLDGAIQVAATLKALKALDLSVPQDVLAIRHNLPWEKGSGGGQIDQLHHGKVTIAGGAAATEIDLLTCLNPFGTACAFARIKAILFTNVSLPADPETPGALAVAQIGGAGAGAGEDEWVGWFAAQGDMEDVQPGTTVAKVTGDPGVSLHTCSGNEWPVVDATHKAIKIANLSAAEALSLEVTILGVAAA